MSTFGKKIHVCVTAALVVAVTWLAMSPSGACAETSVWEKRYEQLAAERAERDADILTRLMKIADRLQSETQK